MVRHDEDGVTRRYAHLGTGNYNPNTARFYTDISLLTCDPAITASMQAVFNYLTAHSESDDYSPLLVAPLTLAEQSVQLIRREAEHARKGRPARIIAKMNSLLEKCIVEALYEASQAGVEIDLIVRGICSLRPGVKGLSERIRVRSLVGRFLEHSRIFYFANGGEEVIYCGSADWMPRNLFERCEVLFPVNDAQLRARLKDEILAAYLADTVKTRILEPSGDYRRVRGKVPFSAQDFFMQLAEGRTTADQIPPAVEMGPTGVTATPTKRRQPVRKKAARAISSRRPQPVLVSQPEPSAADR
jgi:polyphosphate kinase